MLANYSGKRAVVGIQAQASRSSTEKQEAMTAWYMAVAMAPRVIWVTSLVLMLTFILVCQGGFLFSRAASEKVLSVNYICMSIAWPVRPVELCQRVCCVSGQTLTMAVSCRADRHDRGPAYLQGATYLHHKRQVPAQA